jgi:acetyltransferase-like isoleucine patch superfamily enzyme
MSKVARILTAPLRWTVGESMLVRRVRNRMAYPGLQVAPGARIAAQGDLVWGAGAYVGERSVIQVAAQTRLAIGDRCYLGRELEIAPDRSIEIGDLTSIQDRTVLFGDVRIGRYCIFSYNIYISSGTHLFDEHPTWLMKDQDREAGRPGQPVAIEDDCWLGINVVVMPGVTIGKGCVIGANAVVTKSLAPYSVAVGVPARVIRRRLEFTPPRALQFDRDEHLPYFYSGFLVSQDELEHSRKQSAVFALSHFSAALAREGAQRVAVTARALGGDATLRHGLQGQPLSGQWKVLAFDIEAGAGPLEFQVYGATGKPTIAVQRIEAE